MNPAVVIEPTEEPLAIYELRAHLKTDPADDELLGSYLTAAREHLEQIAGVALLPQTLEWTLDAFPCPDGRPTSLNRWGAFLLPRPPLRSVTSVKYIDVSGTQQTLPTDQYVVATTVTPGRIDLAYGKSWPSIRYQAGAVVVRYVAGYADINEVPERWKQALRVIVGTLYRYRESLTEVGPSTTGLVMQLIGSDRMWVTA